MTMSENASKIENAATTLLPPYPVPTEDEVFSMVQLLRNSFPITDNERDAIIRRLHATLQITMDTGTAIVEDHHVSWLPARKAEIEPFYWERFVKYLRRDKWPPRVIGSLDRVTDEILDLMGNPSKESSWSRRGLVMGDVQSGKTATYTALCNKAADAGYRMIVLLTGTLENLRKQTQERMDEGFVGFDSSGLLSAQRKMRETGVGTIDRRKMVGVFTSRRTDFKSDLVNQLGLRLSSFKDPVLVVIKKNKKILENLENWLAAYNADSTGKIDLPFLLIDDEADNASVNTNNPDSDPTSINERIRALLSLFRRSSYVGFTATPFANIFIDPETNDEMIGNDLFPRDFIYALEAPSNYIGAEAIFGEEPLLLSCLKPIRDAAEYIPPSHKSNFSVSALPPSLIEALQGFILINVIRDLRGEGASHRSMLVNVSRFTNVQDQVAALIDDHLREIQREVRNYSFLPAEEACLNKIISDFKNLWERDYDDGRYQWEEIQQSLNQALQPIVVKAVNQRTGAASLDYSAFRDTGLRVIAVGGNSLSRGLTLQGLCVSYFYRNSQMYDTLMQMGRWFGFRDGYADCCRVWMTEEAMHWYAHISLASSELREEIREMKILQLTPKDFGLKVRAHPDALIVTARNKMRTAQTVVKLISLSCELIETPRLRSLPDTIRANANAAASFVEKLTADFGQPKTSGNPIWHKVPKKLIVDFLSRFDSHPRNMSFDKESLLPFLEHTDVASLNEWDVVIPGGEGTEVLFGGIPCTWQKRKLAVDEGKRMLLVSGRNARVGSRGSEKAGLEPEQITQIDTEYHAKNPKMSVPDHKYRAKRERPLLLLHLVRGVISDETGETTYETGGYPLVALGLSFPRFSDGSEGRLVKYRVNLVEWRRQFEEEADDEGDE